MSVLLTNNASSTLAANITSGATSLVIQTGDAALFPAPTGDDWFPLTLVDTAGNREIVKATARSVATITIVRGQEGTTPRSFASGSRAEVRVTAGVLAQFLQADILDTALDGYLPKDGSEAMTGALELAGDAVQDLEAVPKQQLDDAIAALGNLATQDIVNPGQIATAAVFETNLSPALRAGVGSPPPEIATAAMIVMASIAT